MEQVSRRTIIQEALAAAAVFPLSLFLATTPALAHNPPLDPNDTNAKALGYEITSAKQDEKCANCSLFRGKSGDAAGGCTAFPGKDVVAAGYCTAWAKKA